MWPVVTHLLLRSLHAHVPTKSPHRHIHNPYYSVCGVVVCFVCLYVCVCVLASLAHVHVMIRPHTSHKSPCLSSLDVHNTTTHMPTASVQHTSHSAHAVHTLKHIGNNYRLQRATLYIYINGAQSACTGHLPAMTYIYIYMSLQWDVQCSTLCTINAPKGTTRSFAVCVACYISPTSCCQDMWNNYDGRK